MDPNAQMTNDGAAGTVGMEQAQQPINTRVAEQQQEQRGTVVTPQTGRTGMPTDDNTGRKLLGGYQEEDDYDL